MDNGKEVLSWERLWGRIRVFTAVLHSWVQGTGSGVSRHIPGTLGANIILVLQYAEGAILLMYEVLGRTSFALSMSADTHELLMLHCAGHISPAYFIYAPSQSSGTKSQALLQPWVGVLFRTKTSNNQHVESKLIHYLKRDQNQSVVKLCTRDRLFGIWYSQY